MKVTIQLTAGGVTVQHMSDEGVMQLVEQFQRGDTTLGIGIDEDGIAHLATQHVVAIYLDQEEEQGDDAGAGEEVQEERAGEPPAEP